MDLVIQFPGNGMVPRQRFGPAQLFLAQLFMGASSEEGTETLVAHREVMENLQHIKQDRNRYRESNGDMLNSRDSLFLIHIKHIEGFA